MDQAVMWAFGIFATAGLAMFSWLVGMLKGKANKDSTDARFTDLYQRLDKHAEEDRAMHRDVLQELRETNRHLSMTNATLANLSGRFEAQNGHPQ